MTISANPIPAQVIQVEKLCKSFGKVQAVVDLSFAVRKGEVFGFLGPNGAGKTTTLTILEGLKQADGGRAVVLGMGIATRARAVKQRIGVQLQSTSLLPNLTVGEQMLRLRLFLHHHAPDLFGQLSARYDARRVERRHALAADFNGA